MRIESVHAVNFLSFALLEYFFKSGGRLVEGQNLTDNDQENNGSGKTAFQAAIEYALYGTTSLKVRDRDLVRFGYDHATLTVTLYCPQRDEHLKIVRVLRVKSSAKLDVFINELKINIPNLTDGNAYIADWLDISKEDLQNYYIINKERYKSFIRASNNEKIEIITRFSNAKLIDDVIPFIEDDIRKYEKKHEEYKLAYSKQLGVVETLRNEAPDLDETDFHKTNQEKIDELKESIIGYRAKKDEFALGVAEKENEIKRIDLDILNMHDAVKEAQKKLESINDEPYKSETIVTDRKIDELNLAYSSDYQAKNERQKDLAKMEKVLAKVNLILMQDVTCPKCQHVFNPSKSDADLIAEKERGKKIGRVIDILKKKIVALEELLDTHKEQIRFYNNKKSELARAQGKVIENVLNAKKHIADLENLLIHLQTQKETAVFNQLKLNGQVSLHEDYIQTALASIEKIQAMTYDQEVVAAYKEKLDKASKEKQKLVNAKYIQEDKLSEAREWLSNLKSFKGYLAEKFLLVIEAISNQVLKDLKSDIQLKWEGKKLTSSNVMQRKITAYILRNGETRDFNSFSGGERARIEFALIMTIRQLINSTHHYGGLDFLFADEIFEGLDGKGLTNFMQSMVDFDFPILITTQLNNVNMYGKVVKIVKDKGVSTIHE